MKRSGPRVEACGWRSLRGAVQGYRGIASHCPYRKLTAPAELGEVAVRKNDVRTLAAGPHRGTGHDPGGNPETAKRFKFPGDWKKTAI